MWAYESVFYQIYPLGFCGAPFENDGVLEHRILKVNDWIPHIKKLGADAIYFSPVFESDTHGYNTRDYTKIDTRLGTNEDFAQVCDNLHKDGIKVVLDGVFNHVGRGFWAFQDVLKNRESSPYVNWFGRIAFDGNSNYNDGLWYEGWEGHFELVKLNLQNPAVVDYLLESVRRWADVYGVDGLRLHKGKRFVYGHNDMESLRLQLQHATDLAEEQNGGVLVITEGVFGMKGDLGKLDEIVALKKDFQFRLLVDDAHGFGTMGEGGRGTASHFGVVDGVDVLFNTFAKSMAGIGAFVCGPRWLINLLRYNMRSQLYAKSLPMPMVIGALKRLELIRNHPEYQQKLWEIVRVLQSSLKENGFEIGVTNSPVTPVFLKGGIPEATNLVVDLRENHGIFCSMVVYPVIPKGEIILRIIPTAVHTLEDVNVTIEAFKAVRSKLQDGIYAQLPIPVRADEGFLVR